MIEPQDEDQLLARVRAIAGRSLGELAEGRGLSVPKDLRRDKGWVGQLLELVLGASAQSRSAPDFEAIGVELKTLPVAASGRPRESTYVCTVDLVDLEGMRWETSRVRHKLARVLWLPVQAEPSIPLARRRVGSGLLWSPSPSEEAELRADWRELMELIRLGGVDSLTAHHGRHLQIRPKALSSRSKTWAVGESGAPILTVPRGFYLRAAFTRQILERHFVMPR